jgi:hypothetical protein
MCVRQNPDADIHDFQDFQDTYSFFILKILCILKICVLFFPQLRGIFYAYKPGRSYPYATTFPCDTIVRSPASSVAPDRA